MFYCNPCAEECGWPQTMAKSSGRCEVCEKGAVCNDLPSRLLPMPMEEK
jgi:hypothetical protein